MDSKDLEAFAQFLQMNGMDSGIKPSKKQPSFLDTFQGKASLSVGLFAAAVVCFRQFGDLLS